MSRDSIELGDFLVLCRVGQICGIQLPDCDGVCVVVYRGETDYVVIVNPEAARTEGFGLSNMQARAENLGAQFDVRTAAGRGTSIVVRIPTDS